ncbi:Flavin reductase like domain [Rubrobacter radiotolerans]|uniref:Flavin reductase n=1 Tax=Rubrobacter radiotolerans TaxID=42256 RepID=A0A023X6Y2_RUBRA|nr:flavin reductase [Rubrobacter radiotolerans]AHY47785.1 Flavin reductase like domain [Rubrobacter radiotolerans]MDX5892424.1 flavin reductase [Rubrobacter radiotolerans]SMC07715.1 NADH-FMN oxidoreductase RutF, flavin reductase (DIM6/NTAB) family [Rubrobacter radiotolerans DSM 5868]
MDRTLRDLVELEGEVPVWERVFTTSPLVLVGTREKNGEYDLAPKHMAMPVGWRDYFGFVCTPRHRTYHNVRRERSFTVSYPRPSQVLFASLAASPREDGGERKPLLDALPTFPSEKVEGLFLQDGYLFLECVLDRIIDDFGEDDALIVGRIVAARARPDYLRASDGDDGDLIHAAPLLAYLSPGRYAEIRKTFSFPFPANFMR